MKTLPPTVRHDSLPSPAFDAENERGRATQPLIYAVKTTGIFCRPGCPSRRPKPENVEFFETCQQARAAGYRPCKRCRPEATGQPDSGAMAIQRACRTLEQAGSPPPLADLADSVGLSPWHFHRLFKQLVGVTPKSYVAALRAKRIRKQLPSHATVTQAIHAAGYGGSTPFYDTAAATLGMPARKFKNGAPGLVIATAAAECYLGFVLVAATERGICAIELGDDPRALEQQLAARFSQARLVHNDASLASSLAEVLQFLEAPARGLSLPLDIQGTAFQLRVWQALRAIPAGQTATYGEIAARIGAPHAQRAVASACAANKLAVAVPCHRVVRGDGKPGAHRWGADRKQQLLKHERGGNWTKDNSGNGEVKGRSTAEYAEDAE